MERLREDLWVGDKARRRIALVSSDIAGLVRNGGVGTATTNLAVLLANDGHDVTVFYCSRGEGTDREFHLWQEEYLKLGVRLLSIAEPSVPLESLDPAALSYACYEHLKEENFELLFFPDMRGLGYFCALARRQGLAFSNTQICVVLHGPDFWHRNGNKELLSSLKDLQYHFLERKSLELADTVIAPSTHIVDTVRDMGWKLPARTFVQQNPNPDWKGPRAWVKKSGFEEIVFFGRLETRKGVENFCNALDELPSGFFTGRKVTFLGSYSSINYGPAEPYLRNRGKKWRFEWSIIPNYNRSQALQYLRSRNCFAVVPSLVESYGYTAAECVTFGIPFILSDIPAFHELLRDTGPKSRSVFFESDAKSLAGKILSAVKQGIEPPVFRVDPAEVHSDWSDWAARVRCDEDPSRKPARKAKAASPLVSVCIAHRDRPLYLEQCLRSLEAQSYANFEVIVVDDASEKPSTRSFLAKLEKRFAKEPRHGVAWRLLRSQKRGGPAPCRNLAAEYARGEYLLIMDDDNLAQPDELSTFVKVAERTGADILTCPFDRFVDPEPAHVKSRWLPCGNDIGTGFFLNVFGDMNSLIRARVFKELGGLRDFRTPGYEDWDFYTRASLRGYDLQVVPVPLVLYRDHANNGLKRFDHFFGLQLRLQSFGEWMQSPSGTALASVMMGKYFKFRSDFFASQPNFPARFLFNPERTNYFLHHPMGKKDPRALLLQGFGKRFKKPKGVLAREHKDGTFLDVKGGVASFELALDRVPEAQRYLLELDVFSAGAGTFRLEYQPQGELEASATVRANQGLSAGTNKLRFYLDRPDRQKGLRFGIVESPGTYLIRRFELFSDSAPSLRTKAATEKYGSP